jgi:membrane fusion protein (multidrug efflux system)
MTDRPAGRMRKAALIAAAVVALIVLALIGGLPRVRARARLERETAQMAVPVVAVIQAKRAPAVRDLVLPASVRAYVEASIYARTTGYLNAGGSTSARA